MIGHDWDIIFFNMSAGLWSKNDKRYLANHNRVKETNKIKKGV